MIRQAGEEQILYFLDLLFQAAEVRLGNATFGMNQVFDISNATGEIRNARVVVQDAHSNDEQRSQECQQRNVGGWIELIQHSPLL